MDALREMNRRLLHPPTHDHSAGPPTARPAQLLRPPPTGSDPRPHPQGGDTDATTETYDPAGFSDFAVEDRIRLVTNDNGYAGRGSYWRTGTVTHVTTKTVAVSCDDGTTARLRRDDWNARAPHKARSAHPPTHHEGSTVCDTMPNAAGGETPVFDLGHLVQIIETATRHNFTLDANDRAALEHAHNTHTEDGVDDVIRIGDREVSLPLHLRGLAARALLHRM